MTPKPPNKDYKWEELTVKLSGSSFSSMSINKNRLPRFSVSFEIVGNNPVKIGMIIKIEQTEDHRFNGAYIVTKIDGQLVFADPHMP